MIDPGLPASISSNCIQQLVTFQRYESAITNRIFRQLHELERLQRMRQGERLPVPVAVDVSVHTEVGILNSVPAVPAEKSMVDFVEGETETEESVPVASEQSKSPYGDEDVSVDAEIGIVDSIAVTAAEKVKVDFTEGETETKESVPEVP